MNKKLMVLTIAIILGIIITVLIVVYPKATPVENSMLITGKITGNEIKTHYYRIQNMEARMSVSLLIADITEKRNISLAISGPTVDAYKCPVIMYNRIGQDVFLAVAECNIQFAPPGVWTLQVLASGVTTDRLYYALAVHNTDNTIVPTEP